MRNTNKSLTAKKSTGTHSAGSAGPSRMSLGLGAQHAQRAQGACGKAVMRKTTAAVCAAALAACMVPAAVIAQEGRSSQDAASDFGSAQKTEVVYVKTDGTGAQTGVYVVNQFESASATTVRDAGTYESVRNLSDSQELSAEGTSTFELEAGQTYLYQGNLDAGTELPWTIEVGYRLDGSPVSPAELAGKSGRLEMTLSIEPNKACGGDYADNYLLQVSGALDNERATQISAEDATTAQAAGSTQLTYMVFPGKSAEFTVTAQVSEFEFGGWQLVGVPLSIALELDDSELEGAAGDLGKLEDACAELNSGTGELRDGMRALARASAKLRDRAGNLSAGLGELSASGSSLEQGAWKLSEGVGQQAEQLSAAAGQVDVDAAQAAYSQAAQTYTTAFAGAFTKAFNAAYQGYLSAGMSASQAQQAAQADAAQAAGQATAGEQAALEQALEALITAQASKTGYESAASALSEVSSSCAELGAGLSAYAQAAGQLSAGASEWSRGSSQFSSGVADLAAGTRELAEGTQELEDETSGISEKLVDKLRDKLDDYLNPSFELRDFVNGAADNVRSVQFVYMTEAIEAPDDDIADEVPADERGFIEKLLALFGI
ncbi:MAG: hypothetical protein ACI36V_07865 [Coriobacteriales bacterium]